MSVWTHVAGCIRYDAIRLLDIGKNPKDILGKPCLCADWCEESTIPRGSEGSLDYTVYEAPDNQVAAYAVQIFGDLRDFGKEDIPKIKSWLHDIVDGQMIRQGIVTVFSEDMASKEDTIVYLYSDDEAMWIERPLIKLLDK